MAVEHIRKEFDLFIATYKPQKETLHTKNHEIFC